jgi:hypothetical protein
MYQFAIHQAKVGVYIVIVKPSYNNLTKIQARAAVKELLGNGSKNT